MLNSIKTEVSTRCQAIAVCLQTRLARSSISLFQECGQCERQEQVVVVPRRAVGDSDSIPPTRNDGQRPDDERRVEWDRPKPRVGEHQ
jgi:hypothetical protein